MDYIPRVGKIYNTTLTLANTWYEILSATNANAIQGLKIKSRYTYQGDPPGPFDLATSSSPTTYWSDAGTGIADVFAPSTGLYARSAVAGTVIEVMVFE